MGDNSVICHQAAIWRGHSMAWIRGAGLRYLLLPAGLGLGLGADSGGGPILAIDEDQKLPPIAVLIPAQDPAGTPTTRQFPFYPIAGNLDRDLLIVNYV